MKLRRPAVAFYVGILIVTAPFFTIFLIMNKPDLSEEQVLTQRLAELQERLRHAEMLNQQRWQDILALQHSFGHVNNSVGPELLSNITGFGNLWYGSRGTSLDLQLPAIYHYLPHLLSGPESLLPALKVSRGRTAMTMVLGIPTVKRDVQSYLFPTLHNLIDNMNPVERSYTVIIVFIAELDKEYISKQAVEIESQFSEHIETGLLEVIAPPAAFYPDMNKLRQTLGDPIDRVKWRTKQTLDFAYLMMYAQGKGTFYIQLEDDILTKPGYITTMKNYAYKQISLKKDWMILDFCQLGFIGKMFKCVDLSKFVVFFLIFHNDKPVDWLLDHLIQTKVCRFDKDVKDCKKRKDLLWIHYKPSLFQHVGTHSSLRGKVQKLKDRQFGKVSLHVPHDNPSADVSTTLKVYKAYSIQRAYKGDTFFWSLLPQKGDNVTFSFKPPVSIEKYFFRSGNPEHPEDKFFNTTVELMPEVDKKNVALTKTADGFYIAGRFKENNGIAEGEVPQEVGPIKTLRLNILADSDRWAILSEIHLKSRNISAQEKAWLRNGVQR